MPKADERLKPFWQTTDKETVRLYLGDVRSVLQRLPSKSVQTVVTSPPYWGLRDYGVEGQLGSEPSPDCETWGKAQCGRCFVCNMVAVFREVRRVLRDDGTLWLNLGDSYSAGGWECRRVNKLGNGSMDPAERKRSDSYGIPTGNLIGVPWRVALSLQKDGWVLRQDVIWHKPSPMPESVKNRCTKAHEYVFMFSKRMKYYYDVEAIKEKGLSPEMSEEKYAEHLRTVSEQGEDFYQRITGRKGEDNGYKSGNRTGGFTPPGGRNKRSVWSEPHERALLDYILREHPDVFAKYQLDCMNKGDVWKVASFGYPGAHFATFPGKLILPAILAGTSEKGCCTDCGTPYKRVTEEEKLTRERPNDYVKRTGEDGTGNSCANTVAGVRVTTVGWEKACVCATGEVRPCVVLDPFIGSGTTACVCVEAGRSCWGIDLSEEYLRKNAIPRIEGQLFSRPLTAELVPKEVTHAVFGKRML
jgi:DNA modification methylase